MEKLQARKKVYLWLLILLSLCALIPLAVLSKYNHQSGDDYGYAYRTFQIWRETNAAARDWRDLLPAVSCRFL